jgi:uroporphyrinogen decarboxylase
MDRFPMWFGGAPEVLKNIRAATGASSEDKALYDIIGIDYKTIRPHYAGRELERFDDGTWMTEWGIRRGGLHYGQALTHPFTTDSTVADVESYGAYPEPDDFIVNYTDEEIAWAKDYCLIGGVWAPFFHDSTELMDMEDFFLQLYLEPKVCEAIIERCFSFYYELDRRTFEANPGQIDMYFIGNDFGSQRALLISPDMWRQFYKPYMKKLIGQAKDNGCVTAIHSCGDIHDIIGDLIEIGVDAINPIQVGAENMDPETLVREYGADCVFFGGIDENEILQYGTEDEVRAETRRIIDTLGKHGRYIVAASHDYLLPEIPAKSIIAMYDEAKLYGTGRLAM